MKYVLASMLLCLVGCMGVKPETQNEIARLTGQVESLDKMVTDIKARHDAGQISTDEAVAAAKPLLEQLVAVKEQLKVTMDKAKEEGSSSVGAGALIVINILAIIAGRLLGIPGLASSSGGNLLNLGRSMLSRSSAETAKP